MKSPISMTDVPAEYDKPFPAPLKDKLGKTEFRRLSDYFNLTRIGVNHEVIMPGAMSALRHWHTDSDEIVFVLQGEAILKTESGTVTMKQGSCVGFKAGDANGHHLVNESNEVLIILAIGNRSEHDQVIYSDDDLQWVKDGNHYIAAKKDGTPYA